MLCSIYLVGYPPDQHSFPTRRSPDLAKQHGVKALVELHHRTITASANAARRFLDGLDPEHVGAIYDAGNMVIEGWEDRKSTRLNSSHSQISYAVFCSKKKINDKIIDH